MKKKKLKKIETRGGNIRLAKITLSGGRDVAGSCSTYLSTRSHNEYRLPIIYGGDVARETVAGGSKRRARVHSCGAICARPRDPSTGAAAAAAGDVDVRRPPRLLAATATAARGIHIIITDVTGDCAPENRFRPRPAADRPARRRIARAAEKPRPTDTRLRLWPRAPPRYPHTRTAAAHARAPRTHARTTRPPLPRAAELYRPMTAGCFPEKSLRAQCHKARRGATSPPFSRYLVCSNTIALAL